MSDDEDEVKLEPRPLTPPAVDSDVFKNAAFGNLDVLKVMVEGPKTAADGGGEGEGDEKGDDAEEVDAPPAADFDLNARDANGNTTLCWACRNGQLAVVEYLLKQGANIESAGYGGMRPLHFASNFAREKVVQCLLSNGADVDAKDDGGNTALHWGVLTVVTLLVEANAGIQAPNATGATPLHKACSAGHIAIVRKLISAGCNVIVADSKGNTALHVSAASGFRAVVKELLSNGAKVSRNKAGKTASDVATSEEIKKELEAAA